MSYNLSHQFALKWYTLVVEQMSFPNKKQTENTIHDDKKQIELQSSI